MIRAPVKDSNPRGERSCPPKLDWTLGGTGAVPGQVEFRQGFESAGGDSSPRDWKKAVSDKTSISWGAVSPQGFESAGEPELSPDSSVSDQSPTLFWGLQLAMPVRSPESMITHIYHYASHSCCYTRYE